MLDLTPKSLNRRDKETPINKRKYLQPNNSQNEDHTKHKRRKVWDDKVPKRSIPERKN